MRAFALSSLVLVLAAACSPSNDGADAGPAGGPVSGPADTHCGTTVQPTNANVCHPAAAPDAGLSDGDGADAGPEEEAATLFNSEGDDDDCKYHVRFTSTPVRRDTDVTFTVTLIRKDGGAPATGAAPEAEVFLSDVHPAPNSDTKASEQGGGTYTLGPVRFDAAGRWTVRFHFYPECEDLFPDSPHGHAAFFLDVP